VSLGGRLTRGETTGETTGETASHDYSVAELTQVVKETRGMLQAIADGWTQEKLLVRLASAWKEDVILFGDLSLRGWILLAALHDGW
jgi:hypothetical protein